MNRMYGCAWVVKKQKFDDQMKSTHASEIRRKSKDWQCNLKNGTKKRLTGSRFFYRIFIMEKKAFQYTYLDLGGKPLFVGIFSFGKIANDWLNRNTFWLVYK